MKYINSLSIPQFIRIEMKGKFRDKSVITTLPDGSVNIRFSRKSTHEEILNACKKYYDKFFNPNMSLTVKTNSIAAYYPRNNSNKIGFSVCSERDSFNFTIGAAVAICRLLNGQHCDYESIIGFHWED